MKFIRKKSTLFYAPILEYPAMGGPSISVINAIEVLSKISDLHIISSVNQNSKNFKSTKNFCNGISKNFLFIKSPIEIIFNKFLFLKRERILRLCLPLSSLFYAIKITRYVISKNIKIIWVDRVIEKSFFVFFYLDVFRKFFKLKFSLIADTETVYSEFVLRELNFLNKNSIRYFLIKVNGLLCKIFEKYILKNANIVTAVSEFDKNIYETINTKSKIKLFSNTVDLKRYKKKYPIKKKIKNPSILLLGSYGNKFSPMNRARQWLVNSIMPLVWKKNQDIHLYIVGRNAFLSNDIKPSKKVSIHSNVISTIPYLQKCNILVIPLKHESGTRFKIIEAGACKIPCISTELGAEGLNISHNQHLLISNEEKEFAKNILDLIDNSDLSDFLSSNLYELVSKNYSLINQEKEGIDILNSI